MLAGLVVPALVVLLGSTVIGSVVSTVMNNLQVTAQVRRERYAQAVRTIVAWIEYPYRIRRRTDDNPVTLAALAEHGHTLQEQLAETRAWVAAESDVVSQVLEDVLLRLRPIIGHACQQAWREDPITIAAKMNLGDFGPYGTTRSPDQLVNRVQIAISYRFGPRRLLLSPISRRRLDKTLRRAEQAAQPRNSGVDQPQEHVPEPG